MSGPTQRTETILTEPPISSRANSIAQGLLRTERAVGVISVEYDMLRLRCCSGGNYWIDFDGGRVFRGKTLFKSDELQPTFVDAMERAGRQTGRASRERLEVVPQRRTVQHPVG